MSGACPRGLGHGLEPETLPERSELCWSRQERLRCLQEHRQKLSGPPRLRSSPLQLAPTLTQSPVSRVRQPSDNGPPHEDMRLRDLLFGIQLHANNLRCAVAGRRPRVRFTV